MNAPASTTLLREPASDMPMARVVRAYLCEARTEFLHLIRTPGMVIPFLLLPAPLYYFFGVVLAGSSSQAKTNPELANYLLSGWCVYAAMGPAIFGVGCPLAVEREAGLLKLKRALPAPVGSYLLAKMLMAMAFAALAIAVVFAVAIAAGKITLGGGELVALAAVMIIGAVPFAAIGLFIGAYASGSASPAFANLVFLPMVWLAGLFFPLPPAMQKWVVIWPAFHLNQIAVAAAGIDGFRFFDPAMAAAIVLGFTVLFGGLAIRRLARVG
jgi:ABC-2 type transport system permease protein